MSIPSVLKQWKRFPVACGSADCLAAFFGMPRHSTAGRDRHLVNAVVVSARRWGVAKMLESSEMSSCQRRSLESIAQTWKHIGPHDYGKHDVIEFLARQSGWNPLVVGESMSVGIGSRRYEIKRVE